MKPPICELCYEDVDASGALLSFRLSPEDEAWHKRQAEEDFDGHPPEKAWFCGKHVDEARKLTDLTLTEALMQMEDHSDVKYAEEK